MQRLLMVTDNLEMSGSFWRSGGPFTSYRKQFKDLDVQWKDTRECYNPGGNTWTEIRFFDWIFMHRPFSKDHYTFICRAKEMGVKVWVDYDDHLFSVPLDNETSPTYNTAESHSYMLAILKIVDVVTTSTPFLKEVLDTLRGKDDVILTVNAVPLDWWNSLRSSILVKQDSSKKPVVMWRGSRHHQRDVYTFKDGIIKAMNDFKDIQFEWVGHIPWCISTAVKHNNYRLHGVQKLDSYHKNIMKAQPDLTMVPLWNCQFNLAKSNIGWIESTLAGAITLAPNWPHWAHPGVQNYDVNDSSTFSMMLNAACEEMMRGDYLKKKWDAVNTAWKFIENYYNIEDINAQFRRPIINGDLSFAIESTKNYMAEVYPLFKSQRHVMDANTQDIKTPEELENVTKSYTV